MRVSGFSRESHRQPRTLEDMSSKQAKFDTVRDARMLIALHPSILPMFFFASGPIQSSTLNPETEDKAVEPKALNLITRNSQLLTELQHPSAEGPRKIGYQHEQSVLLEAFPSFLFRVDLGPCLRRGYESAGALGSWQGLGSVPLVSSPNFSTVMLEPLYQVLFHSIAFFIDSSFLYCTYALKQRLGAPSGVV